MTDAVARLAVEGVSVWLESPAADVRDLERIGRAIEDGKVSGITVTGSDHRAAETARWACDLLGPVHERTGGRDGLVTLSGAMAETTGADALVRGARALVREADRPNLLVSLPASEAGTTALTALLCEGIGAMAGPVFSAERYVRVVRAHIAGITAAHREGLDVSSIASVAAFRVGAMDTEIDKLLDRAGSDESKALRGRAALAGARLAYRTHAQLYDARPGSRWSVLAEAGARPQRLMWADAYDRTPGRRPTRYVEELVAPGTITGLPVDLLERVADVARIAGPRAHREHECARRLLDYLGWFGIRYDDVVLELEKEHAHA